MQTRTQGRCDRCQVEDSYHEVREDSGDKLWYCDNVECPTNPGGRITPNYEVTICIGGVASGHRGRDISSQTIVMTVANPITVPYDPRFGFPEEATFRREVYKRETFRSGDGNLTLWVPTSQNPIETMTKLIEVYENAAQQGLLQRLTDAESDPSGTESSRRRNRG